MNPSTDEPLDIKVSTPSKILWEKTLFETKQALENNKVNQIIQELVIELAKKKIAEEKEKLK